MPAVSTPPTATIIPAEQAVAEFAAGRRPIIIDGSLDLASPRFDGDYRATSGRSDWLKERIVGSVHVDLLSQWVDPDAGYHFAAPRPDALADQLAELGIDGRTPVWLYDRTNLMWASRLWWTLRNAGIPALVIDGGLAAWREAGGPVESGLPTTAPVPGPRPQPRDLGVWVGRVEVQELVAAPPADDAPILICALSEDAMWGRVPTRYSRRGHIPGSVNLAGHALLGTDGRLLAGPGAAAVADFTLAPDRALIIYCGGGISASLTGLALVHEGWTDVRIYDGSLEEWSARPELALVRA